MNVKNGKWRISSRDLFKSSCEHCTRIDMAHAAKVPGVVEKVEPFKEDLNEVLFVQQGHEFERLVFDKLKEQLKDGFVELTAADMPKTIDLLKSGTKVVAQGFLEAEVGGYAWSGYPDLLIREDFTYENGELKQISEPKPEAKYVVWDVKATSDPGPEYWLQLASYSKVLADYNLSSELDLGIIYKQFKTLRQPSSRALNDLAEATATLLERLDKTTPDTITEDFIEVWHCEKPTACKESFCQFPKHCKHLLKEEHSLHLLFGRNKVEDMRKAGINNWDDLITNDNPDWENSRAWARILKKETDTGEPQYDLLPKENWLPIPEPTVDDMFFDIEWFNDVQAPETLVFQFGFVDAKGNYTTIDGLNQEDELPNFKEFVRQAKAKMDANPLARIYHWTPPEKTYLEKLRDKHNILHDEVNLLVSRLVDLAPIARSMIRPGANGYSIKVLEKYYDADTRLNRKENGVTGGVDAMMLFYRAIYLDKPNAQQYMDKIRDYNKDDCLSTLLCRDWLLSL